MSKHEYIEVTNEIPVLTDIEVRNSEREHWVVRTFLAKRGEGEYLVETPLRNAAIYTYARILKDWKSGRSTVTKRIWESL